jgi:ribosomal protein S18 acetylase RimI-like enzyme
MIIRAAHVGDAAGIARVHVDTWRTTYRGIVPDDYLANLSYEEREKEWKTSLSRAREDRFTFVAEGGTGRIIGFVTGGPNRYNEPQYQSELYAIYVLKEYQGQGIGRDLTRSLVRSLLASGSQSMMLWVFAGNTSSRRFYEALGGQFVKSNHFEINGAVLEEIAYGWTDISVLLKE